MCWVGEEANPPTNELRFLELLRRHSRGHATDEPRYTYLCYPPRILLLLLPLNLRLRSQEIFKNVLGVMLLAVSASCPACVSVSVASSAGRSVCTAIFFFIVINII